MKKILALVLALCMVFALCACGNTPADGNKPAEESKAPEAAESSTPAAPEAPAYKVAMITDYGDITDQSFNQTTYEACKEYCEAGSLDFKYFKPVGDSTVSGQSGPPSPAVSPVTVQATCPPTLSPCSFASAARRRRFSSSTTWAVTVTP